MPATVYNSIPLVFSRSFDEFSDRLDVHFNEPRWDDFEKEFEDVLNKYDAIPLTEATAQFNVGLTTAATKFYCDEGVPFLRGENVYESGIDLSSETFVPEEQHNEWVSSQVKPGYIVINLVGNIGDACVIPESLPKAQINRALGRIIPNEDVVSSEYLIEFLNSNLGKGQFMRHSQGGMQRRFNHPDGCYVRVPVVSKEKELLNRMSIIFDLTKEVNKKAKLLKQKRYGIDVVIDSIFINSVSELNVPDGVTSWRWQYSTESFLSLCTKSERCAIVNKAHERIDARFHLPNRLRKQVVRSTEQWGILSDYSLVERITYQSDASLSHIAIDEMPNDPWEVFQANDGYSGSTVLLENGDIGISRLMPTIMNGKCFISWAKMTGSAEFIRVRADEKYQRIILFWLKSALVREFLLANVRGSSASQKRFTEDDLKSCPIPKDIIENPEKYLPECEKALEDAMRYEQESFELQNKADDLLKKAKSNIFNLLDDDWFNELVSEAKEALQ